MRRWALQTVRQVFVQSAFGKALAVLMAFGWLLPSYAYAWDMKGGGKQKMKKRVEFGRERMDRLHDRSINNLIIDVMTSYRPIFCLVLFTPIHELEDDITYNLSVKDEKTS